MHQADGGVQLAHPPRRPHPHVVAAEEPGLALIAVDDAPRRAAARRRSRSSRPRRWSSPWSGRRRRRRRGRTMPAGAAVEAGSRGRGRRPPRATTPPAVAQGRMASISGLIRPPMWTSTTAAVAGVRAASTVSGEGPGSWPTPRPAAGCRRRARRRRRWRRTCWSGRPPPAPSTPDGAEDDLEGARAAADGDGVGGTVAGGERLLEPPGGGARGSASRCGAASSIRARTADGRSSEKAMRAAGT